MPEKKCESNNICLNGLSNELKVHCQSDSIIADFKRNIQRLENDLKITRRNCGVEADANNLENLIDVRMQA